MIVTGVVVLAFIMGVVPIWRVWQQRLVGEAQLARAENARQVQVIQARAEKEAAQLHADAIAIIGKAAQEYPEYRTQEFIGAFAEALREGKIQQLMYVLPWSISGLWKADLFVGYTDTDRWVATTVKINPAQLEGAQGLRIGIVPARGGGDDLIRRDDTRNLVICPLPHDQSFMEVFYQGWGVVRQFIAADAIVPKEVNLPRQADRQVARYLQERREFAVLEVIDALQPLSQPELLQTEQQNPTLVSRRESNPEIETGAVVAPIARTIR
jgi:hypothetical protein